MKIARCPFCNSIWVCWNWINAWGGDFEKYCEMNPHMSRGELKQTQWGHECWNCGDDLGGSYWETTDRVTNGIPYWILRYIHGAPDIIYLFFYKLFHREDKDGS